MKQIALFIVLSGSLAAAQAAPPPKEQQREPLEQISDLVDVAKTFGELGVMTLDATAGELLVRAYPSTSIVKQHFDGLPADIELNCDTYRSGAANHYVAAATACHVQYSFVAKNSLYTLSGPFRQTDTVAGSDCEPARQLCAAYKAALVSNEKRVAIVHNGKIVGSFDFSGMTPTYRMQP